ncbi:hypothetical protein V2S04_07175 [Microbacterium sp. OR21]|uniref:hypothetical protein n=1 Tax=Microbacterium sp. OR21 TaxID=3095346 RepID=UPI0039B68510
MSAATRSTGRAAAQPAAQPSNATGAAAPAPAPVEPPYELVDIDRYAVFDNGIIGYVEVIPPLFICYSGHPYPTAVEVAQVFDFAQAVRCVRDAAPHSHDHGRSAA